MTLEQSIFRYSTVGAVLNHKAGIKVNTVDAEFRNGFWLITSHAYQDDGNQGAVVTYEIHARVDVSAVRTMLHTLYPHRYYTISKGDLA
jgi:hypothetical protein